MEAYRRSPFSPRRLAGVFAVAALTASLAAGADPRILSVTPTADGWRVTMTDADAASFSADGIELSSRAGGAEGGAASFEVTGMPADASRLIAKAGGRQELAVRVGTHSEEAAPFNDWIIYHIMMAYFRNGSKANDRAGMRRWVHRNYAGGDLQGVLDKADFLAGLGVNAVWLSPMFASETSHGYDVTNYYRVGDAMAVPGKPEASLELYREVAAALRERGIRVVLDVPLNHASRSYDKKRGDPNKRKPKSTKGKQEAEKVWESWNANYQYWNFKHEGTREFLKEVALYWLVEERVDGLRLDYVRGVPHDFWAEFYAAVKTARPDAFLFGEAWQDAAAQGPNATDTAGYYEQVPGVGPQFDGLLDFPLQLTLVDVFARGGSATQIETWLQRTAALYGDTGRPIYFLDNHDVSRFLAWTDTAGEERLVAALAFMGSLSSPMVMFYGTETGLRGGGAKRGFIDNSRVPVPWGSLNEALIARVSAIFALRGEQPAMARGGRLPLHADDETLVMAKIHPAGNLLVAVNVSDAERRLEIPVAELVDPGTGFEPLLDGGVPVLESGTLRWTLPPLSTSLVAIRSE